MLAEVLAARFDHLDEATRLRVESASPTDCWPWRALRSVLPV
jgi:hypothetical protein